MEFKDRFRTLREDYLHMTRDALAKSLGFKTRSKIDNIELGRTQPDDVFIDFVCQKYHVKKDWLINGIGDDPFEEKLPTDERADLFAEFLGNPDDPVYSLLYDIGIEYMNADPEMRKAIRQFVSSLKSRRKEKDAE